MTRYKITSHEDYREHLARIRRYYAQVIRGDAQVHAQVYTDATFLMSVVGWVEAYHNQIRMLGLAYCEWLDSQKEDDK